MFPEKKIYTIIYCVVLAVFTVFVVLDAFVIPKGLVFVEDASSHDVDKVAQDNSKSPEDYLNQNSNSAQSQNTVGSSDTTISESGNTTDSSSQNSDQSSSDFVNGMKTEPVITENSYKDDKIEINITSDRKFDTNIYVADVKISDVGLLKDAFANDTFGQNIKAATSETAKAHDAIFAVNGDYYGAREGGYVIRNGQLYRSKKYEKYREDMVIYSDGRIDIISEDDYSAEDLLNKGAKSVYSFGPGLVYSDGSITTEKTDQKNPRTAMGMFEPGHYLFIVTDGRTSESEGLTYKELAELGKEYGISVLYNLDGGGSSSMYFNGNVVNTPTSGGTKIRERNVSDIVYIGY